MWRWLQPREVGQLSSSPAPQDNVTLISAMAARVAGVGGAGLRWMAKRSLMVQPLGWSMYCSGEVMLSRQYDKDQKKIAEAVRGLPAEKTSWLVRSLPLSFKLCDRSRPAHTVRACPNVGCRLYFRRERESARRLKSRARCL